MEMIQSQRKMEALCVIITGTQQDSLWDSGPVRKSQVRNEKIIMLLIVGLEINTEDVHEVPEIVQAWKVFVILINVFAVNSVKTGLSYPDLCGSVQ